MFFWSLTIVRNRSGNGCPIALTVPSSQIALQAKVVEFTLTEPRVHLTGKEYAMLELLSLRKGHTLTKEMFLNHLYGAMDEP